MKSLAKTAKSTSLNQTSEKILKFLDERILGKQEVNRLALACILAKGHLLLEDVPGVGKTTLAKSLGEALGLKVTRIQFTNDLLPADVIGGTIFNSITNEFVLKRGPIFSEFVLADELNRGSPRTQSAVLEAMEEGKVTIEGNSMELPKPFLFVATQNPHFQSGTNPLPESQLDRFLMNLHVGFPDSAAERELIRRGKSGTLVTSKEPITNKEELLAMQLEVDQIHMQENIVSYIQKIVERTRTGKYFGVSPRGAIALSQASRAMAYINQRDFVIPEDVQFVGVAVLAHRWARNDQEMTPTYEKVRELFLQVEVP